MGTAADEVGQRVWELQQEMVTRRRAGQVTATAISEGVTLTEFVIGIAYYLHQTLIDPELPSSTRQSVKALIETGIEGAIDE